MSDDAQQRALQLIRSVSLRTKATILTSEYTHGQLQPQQLRDLLGVLASSDDERSSIAHAVEEELRSARYPVSEIMRLMGVLMGAGDAPSGEAPAPGNGPDVLITRKVRSPSLMPFERFEFSQEQEIPAPEPEQPTRPRQSETAVVKRSVKFVSGGETAGFGGGAFRGFLHSQKPGGGDTRPSVMVADDDSRSRMMYRAKLEESGFHVIEAKDGIEAWNLIKSGDIECAVMDMKMPGYHGLEVLSRMVDANLILPVVVVSAFDQLANEFVIATYPRLTFLTKPAPPEEVANAVRGHLKKRADS